MVMRLLLVLTWMLQVSGILFVLNTKFRWNSEIVWDNWECKNYGAIMMVVGLSYRLWFYYGWKNFPVFLSLRVVRYLGFFMVVLPMGLFSNLIPVGVSSSDEWMMGAGVLVFIGAWIAIHKLENSEA